MWHRHSFIRDTGIHNAQFCAIGASCYGITCYYACSKRLLLAVLVTLQRSARRSFLALLNFILGFSPLMLVQLRRCRA